MQNECFGDERFYKKGYIFVNHSGAYSALGFPRGEAVKTDFEESVLTDEECGR